MSPLLTNRRYYTVVPTIKVDCCNIMPREIPRALCHLDDVMQSPIAPLLYHSRVSTTDLVSLQLQWDSAISIINILYFPRAVIP